RLVLIRHGESAGNRDRVFTRTPEVPLTDAGRAQVLRGAERVAARYLPVAVVSSPFLRARQTAAILAERLALAVRVEEDLREQSYGELAGQPYAALRAASDYDPARYWLWRPPGGGETLVEVAARAGAALDRVAAGAPGRDVVVVSHGGVMAALWRHVTGEWGMAGSRATRASSSSSTRPAATAVPPPSRPSSAMHAPAERLGVLIDTCHLHAAGFASPEPGRGGPPGRCARRRGLLGRLIAFHPERLQGPRRLPARPP